MSPKTIHTISPWKDKFSVRLPTFQSQPFKKDFGLRSFFFLSRIRNSLIPLLTINWLKYLLLLELILFNIFRFNSHFILNFHKPINCTNYMQKWCSKLSIGYELTNNRKEKITVNINQKSNGSKKKMYKNNSYYRNIIKTSYIFIRPNYMYRSSVFDLLLHS